MVLNVFLYGFEWFSNSKEDKKFGPLKYVNLLSKKMSLLKKDEEKRSMKENIT